MERQTMKHGEHRTKTYVCWYHMIARCSNPNAENYKHYGGRGITVCERWRKYENFKADMGVCPAGLTLERNDNNGNYEPNNCRWATWVDQRNNTRSNRMVEYKGKILTVAQACRAEGVSYNCGYTRFYRTGTSGETSKDGKNYASYFTFRYDRYHPKWNANALAI